MFDVIVVGSRCAGASTAMLLARHGRRVLLVDRATFPSDVLSGHTIQPAGVAHLRRWGLLDRVRATGVPFTSHIRFDFGPVVLEGVPAPVDGVTDAVCIRRTVFDTLLTAEAADAGADVRQGFTVKSLLWDDGKVVGIRGRDATGRTIEERARVVIGADGVNSFVARAVDAASYNHVPAKTVNIYSYWRGLDLEGLELYTRPGRFFVATPTNDGLAFVNQTVPVHEAGRYGTGRPTHMQRRSPACRTSPNGSWLLSGWSGSGGRPPGDGFFRVAAGPGWALVGDAGYHLDPITAKGMFDAFRDAELLAGAVDRGLSGDLDDELSAISEPATPRRCRCTSSPRHWPTSKFRRQTMLGLIAALAGNPAQTSRFFGLMAGSVPIPEFFSPESLTRVFAEAQALAA